MLRCHFLDHLNQEPLKGFEKVDQKPLDGSYCRLVENEVALGKWQRTADIIDGKGDVVEDGLATEELDELGVRFRDNEFDHCKPGREGDSTLKGRHRPPDQRLMVLESLSAKTLGNAYRSYHHTDVMEFHDPLLGKPVLKEHQISVFRSFQ
jgi:hypothetical protein